MAYRCFPWPIDTEIDRMEVTPLEKDSIMLMNGCIDLNRLSKPELGPADFTIEKIEKASFLKKHSA
jgi:hypothetical protein